MRSLAYLGALFATVAVSWSMSACLPDDADPNYMVVPVSGPPVASGTGQGDNTGGGGGGPGPNVPGDGGLDDGGVFGDTGPLLDAFDNQFLDAFDFPMDAP